jgi:hypothetical protein
MEIRIVHGTQSPRKQQGKNAENKKKITQNKESTDRK